MKVVKFLGLELGAQSKYEDQKDQGVTATIQVLQTLSLIITKKTQGMWSVSSKFFLTLTSDTASIV